MTRIPSAGTPITLRDLAAALLAADTAPFCNDLARFLNARHLGLAGSGLTSFYLILRALAARSPRKEVILPAYTAPSLVLPILKLGLKPVLVDVSLETLNMDMALALHAANPNTLAILAVHMFGIPCDITAAREAAAAAAAFLIEDAASAMGATINGRQAGTLGDVGFLSFNRGKNLSTAGGGAWITQTDRLAEDIHAEARRLPTSSLIRRIAPFFRLAGLSAAVRPSFYTLAHPILKNLKHDAPHPRFDPIPYTATQAGAGRSILSRFPRILAARNERAARAREILHDANGLALPAVLPQSAPAYNQIPLLLTDPSARNKALDAALTAGLECTTLYDRTVRATYGLGPDRCGGGLCPNAEQVASRLLLIPCHPLVPMARLEQAAEAIKRAAHPR